MQEDSLEVLVIVTVVVAAVVIVIMVVMLLAVVMVMMALMVTQSVLMVVVRLPMTMRRLMAVRVSMFELIFSFLLHGTIMTFLVRMPMGMFVEEHKTHDVYEKPEHGHEKKSA